MKTTSAILSFLICACAVNSQAIDLKQSKVTQVVNDVEIISAADQSQKNATVNDVFKMPDILKTGAGSRAELVAADETVTRVGANTIFSFDPATRTIDLKQGSLLFHSPHGKGGGTIHTGSATASVLGTTLIVTTTPSGGLKVLDLEGSVEVNFLNGLKQKLAPGQMSFVLPGANQLSPIIIYRLDTVADGNLVKGFKNPLASLPLIEQQIEKQMAELKSGKLGDTGLAVGSDANSQGVQVIPLDTLQNALNGASINSAAVRAAFAKDATIDQPSLSYAGIPVPPNRIFTDEPFILTGSSFFAGQPFIGFAAKNIYFNAPASVSEGEGSEEFSLSPHDETISTLDVDLSPYVALSEFDFVAANNIEINTDVNFQGLSESDSIYFSLVAGNQILIASGVSVRADVANFDWQTPGTVTFDGDNVYNGIGNTAFGVGAFTMQNGSYLQTAANLTVQTLHDININNSTIAADTIFLTSQNGKLNFNSSTATFNSFGIFTAQNGINIQNSVFAANSDSGAIAFNSGAGSVNITGTSIQAQYLSVNSGDGILLDGNGHSVHAANVNLTAKNSISVNNANLNNVSVLNMVANTITLINTILNPNVPNNFGVATGLANINNGVKTGEANFINDYLGTTALTETSQINFSSGPSSAAGVNVYRTQTH